MAPNPNERGTQELPPGSQLGRYKILRVAGEGGMGVVYEAKDPRLGRHVALKVLHDTVEDRVSREIILSEARALAHLGHPNIVPIYDVGRTSKGWFITMRYIEGQPLMQWCRDRGWADIVDRLIEVAQGLHAAHRHGVIHRDCKPGNILIDSRDNAQLVDFGISIIRAGNSISTVSIDRRGPGFVDAPKDSTSIVAGTPAYVAPEQLRGQEATPLSDQFAFCASLFEALSGRVRFHGKDAREHLEARYRAPPLLSAEEAPLQLVEIIQSGLEVDPRDRHASMADVADALLALRRAPRRRAWWIVASAGVVAVTYVGIGAEDEASLCLGAATSLDAEWQDVHRPTIKARGTVVSDLSTLGRVDAKLNAFVREWAIVFANSCKASNRAAMQSCLWREANHFRESVKIVGQPETSVHHTLEIVAQLPPPEDCADPDPGSPFVWKTQLESAVAGAESLFAAGRIAEAEALQRSSLRLIERFATTKQRVRSLFVQGKIYYARGSLDDARSAVGEAYGLASSSGHDQLSAGTSLTLMVWSTALDESKAQHLIRQARAAAERTHDAELLGEFYVELGWIHSRQLDLVGAARSAESAESILGRDFPPTQSARTADRWSRLQSLFGFIALSQGDFDSAQVFLSAGLDVVHDHYGKHSTLAGRPMAGLVQAMAATGELDLAESVLDEHERSGTTSVHSMNATSALLRVDLSLRRGQLSEGRDHLEDLSRNTSPENPYWLPIQERLGSLHLATQRFQEARIVFQRIAVQLETQSRGGGVEEAYVQGSLALAELRQGEFELATRNLSNALEIADRTPPDAWVRAYVLTVSAELDLEQGRFALARNKLEQALVTDSPSPSGYGMIRFALARALWRSGGDSDCHRAVQLAVQSAESYRALPGYSLQAQDIDRWLETR